MDMVWILMEYIKIAYQILCTSYLCEVAYAICYQGLIGNNHFVSFITNKGNIAYIPHFNYCPPPKLIMPMVFSEN